MSGVVGTGAAASGSAESADTASDAAASGADVSERPSWWVAILLAPIRFYQRYLSWMLGENCKYFPSCSSYALQALTRHGVLKGGALAVWRLLRCNPWSRGGSDRVPARGRWRPDPYVAPVFEDDDGPAAHPQHGNRGGPHPASSPRGATLAP